VRTISSYAVIGILFVGSATAAPPLPNVQPLDWEGDIASRLVDAADAFLLRELDRAEGRRDGTSTNASLESLNQRRERLAKILGVRDERVASQIELVTTVDRDPRVGIGDGYQVFQVRWPALDGISGEGLLLVPDGTPRADVIAIPDADQTPEMLVGLTNELPAESQFARVLAESGCRVLVPMLLSREREPRNGRSVMTHREYIYRSAFELGRHVIGYELQKVLAAVDVFAKADSDRPIGIAGYGEGGMLALYAAALDERIDATLVSGYFDDRRTIWQQPIARNVFGLLEHFGDAELARMIHPRSLVIEASLGPELELPPGQGGAPAVLTSPPVDRVRREFDRAEQKAGEGKTIALVVSGDDGRGPFGTERSLKALLGGLKAEAGYKNGSRPPQPAESLPDREARLRRQMTEMDRFSQRLLVDSPYVRTEFMKGLDTSSVEKYRASSKHYRDVFRDEVIGSFDEPFVEPHPRARVAYENEKWTGYEVALDVFDGFFAYGVLLVPNDIKDGEQRPVVVCQHGLEGRPKDIIEGDHPAYHDFAAKLAERGFVVFAPQHIYLFGDRFRTLQRKANPVGKSLFSLMVPQHEQLLKWLKTLPFVDGDRIGFYGLSYGGKSAMRIPALVEGYALSICSADFNNWVWKNASTRSPYSYVWTNEYEIFEFDLGSTFNYAEMAALIAPRPFMVERGHFDGVAPDEEVAYEFAKVRHLYEARLKLKDTCEIEFFVGPHTINGQGTYRFLHHHLNWPKPQKDRN
jgi:dienelactone hydrolase